MGKSKIYKTMLVGLLGLLIVSSYSFTQVENSRSKKHDNYDIRTGLTPSRLNIAMWDFSWLYMHYPGGAFENFDRVVNELKERGFNAVRIDAFPLIIGKMENNDQKVTIPGGPLLNWGASDQDRKHQVILEFLEFMKITKKKGISVILSSWGQGASEYPNIKNDYTDRIKFWKAWEKVLNLLKENDLLSHVAYVDFDQEFPYFSPFASMIDRLGEVKEHETTSNMKAMEAAGKAESNFKNLKWNPAQMSFVRDYMNNTLTHFQSEYPELRFTFSLTNYWEEVRAMNLKSIDVLELHIWMNQSERFSSRSGFDELKKDRGEHDYKDYADRIAKTMKSIRPMLLKDMHNRLAYAKEWSDEIAAPLVTTEAWGPWWHMDHQDLDWEWLYDWCEECMGISSEYKLWGATPWNYSHPYWENWKNVQWYKKVNTHFLKN